jgi:hypothetical protein
MEDISLWEISTDISLRSVMYWETYSMHLPHLCANGFNYEYEKIKTNFTFSIYEIQNQVKVKVKGKVVPVLFFFLAEHHAMKAYWGVEV